MKKCEYEFSEYYILLLFFFRRGLIRPVKENSPTKKANQCRNSSDTETCTSSKTCLGENVLQVIATTYKTKLQINITCIQMCFP